MFHPSNKQQPPAYFFLFFFLIPYCVVHQKSGVAGENLGNKVADVYSSFVLMVKVRVHSCSKCVTGCVSDFGNGRMRVSIRVCCATRGERDICKLTFYL